MQYQVEFILKCNKVAWMKSHKIYKSIRRAMQAAGDFKKCQWLMALNKNHEFDILIVHKY